MRCAARARPPVRALWRAARAGVHTIPNVIGGKLLPSSTGEHYKVLDPATQTVLALAPQSTAAEIDKAVDTAHDAYLLWRHTPMMTRVRLMLDYQARVRTHLDELAGILTREHGKTLEDARGSLLRGLEAIEYAAGAPGILKGAYVPHVARGLDSYTVRRPLGVCAAIMPSNFPGMIPLWTLPLAVVAGNAVVLKPSEQVPLTAMRLVALFRESLDAVDAPRGLAAVVHGREHTVDALCVHPRVRALSFVGGDAAGRHVHSLGTRHGKRVQSNLAAKNHCIIMPDAPREQVVRTLSGAAFGNAGQRCMALSVAVFVGETHAWLADVAAEAGRLVISAGDAPGAQLGPLLTRAHRDRVAALITQAEQEGARIVLDGRGLTVAAYPDGNFIGPTILDGVTADMSTYRTEIFGPVLQAVSVARLDDALALINANPYGNGAAIFTRDLSTSRRFVTECEAGQLGINVALPVGPVFMGFTGNKGSQVGARHFLGEDGMRFFTEEVCVSQLARAEAVQDPLAMPVHT